MTFQGQGQTTSKVKDRLLQGQGCDISRSRSDYFKVKDRLLRGQGQDISRSRSDDLEAELSPVPITTLSECHYSLQIILIERKMKLEVDA